MTDYKRYCGIAGISEEDMMVTLSKAYPGYDADAQKRVTEPDRYGLRLLAEAEAVLVAAFGEAPGLSGKPRKTGQSHNSAVRPHRLYARISSELYSRLRDVMGRMNFATEADLIEAAIAQFVDKYGTYSSEHSADIFPAETRGGPQKRFSNGRATRILPGVKNAPDAIWRPQKKGGAK